MSKKAVLTWRILIVDALILVTGVMAALWKNGAFTRRHGLLLVAAMALFWAWGGCADQLMIRTTGLWPAPDRDEHARYWKLLEQLSAAGAASGKTINELAREAGLSRNEIRRILRPPPERRKASWSDHQAVLVNHVADTLSWMHDNPVLVMRWEPQ